MYSILNVIDECERQAEDRAFIDRMKYRKIMEIVEKFAIENNLIVGGIAATKMLLKLNKLKLDSFRYEFYSGNASQVSRQLGDVLFKNDMDDLCHYVTVMTKIADYQFSISVDGRELIIISSLPIHRGVKTSDVVIPSRCIAPFTGKEIQCFGPELQLINIYSTICDPSKSNLWCEQLDAEIKLRKLLQSESKILDKIGAAESPKYMFSNELLHKFTNGPGRMLTGPIAINIYRGNKPFGRLQIITSNELEQEEKEISELAVKHNINVYFTINDPKLPTDVRLRRMTVYINDSVNGTITKEPICDIFNVASYEVVPFVLNSQLHPPNKLPATLKIGSPFVLMRFRLVDAWIMQILVRMDAVKASYAKGVINMIMMDYAEISNYCEKNKHKMEIILPINYLGIYEEIDLALKRAAFSGTKFISPPYMPAAA